MEGTGARVREGAGGCGRAVGYDFVPARIQCSAPYSLQL